MRFSYLFHMNLRLFHLKYKIIKISYKLYILQIIGMYNLPFRKGPLIAVC